jgi:hypothetical protein
MQKFLIRSALQPNQISFSHGLDPNRPFVLMYNREVTRTAPLMQPF